jgi:hypothetical protein
MFYIFNRTTGNAQKYLLSRFDESSLLRFKSATEMIQHLAAIYVNPNKTRDARYAYGRLMIKANQPFAEFQTTFLHLAGEGEVPADNLHIDLYNKLTTSLQERLATILPDLDTYNKLATRCLTADTELRRITTRVDRQKRFKDERASTTTPLGVGPTQGHIAKTPFLIPSTIRLNTPPTVR